MVKVCVPGYSIFGQRRVSTRFPLEKHPHSSLRGWSHPSLRGYSSMSIEYPKLNNWTKANLGKFLIPLLYKGLFLLYKGLPVGFIIPSLRRYLAMGSEKKSLVVQKSFHGIIPCYPSIGYHPSTR